jgi:hypothetical protein
MPHPAASALDKCSGPEPVERGDTGYNTCDTCSNSWREPRKRPA